MYDVMTAAQEGTKNDVKSLRKTALTFKGFNHNYHKHCHSGGSCQIDCQTASKVESSF